MRFDAAQLVERARTGDPEALEELARHALRLALRTATGMLGDRDGAADVAQEVAVDVLKDLHRLRDPERFDQWVHRIAARRSVRAARSRRRRMIHEDGTLLERAAVEVLTVDEAAEGALDARLATGALRVALGLLPPRQRVAVVLRYVHDLSQDEIAEALGCRRGTAGSLVSRGLAGLRSNANLLELAPSRSER